MSQNTGFDAAGGSSSDTTWRGSTSETGALGGGTGGGAGGSSYEQDSSGGQNWMPRNVGGQAGDMMNSVREFGRNNPKLALGASVLGVIALARYATSGNRRNNQRSGGWFGSGGSRDNWRGGQQGYGRDAFSGSGRYTGANYGREHSSWGMGRAGRYGMDHPVGLTAGAALGALALSWLARSQMGGQSRQGGSWQGSGSGQSFGSQSFGDQGSGGSTSDWQGGQGSGTTSGENSSFGGSQGGSTQAGGESFGRGSMSSDPIEASGSSRDFGQATSSTFSGASRTGTTSAGSI